MDTVLGLSTPAAWVVSRIYQCDLPGGWGTYGTGYSDEAEARAAHDKLMPRGTLSSELLRWDGKNHVRVAFRRNNSGKRKAALRPAVTSTTVNTGK